MIELQGKYNNAKVFTDNAEQSTIQQIEHLLISLLLREAKFA